MRLLLTLVLSGTMAVCPAPASAQKHHEKPAPDAKPIVWVDPGDIHSRDLYYGLGKKKDVPIGPFTFVDEDKGGTSPKFEVTDASGEKWKAKLGPEAQPETAASRIMWAVGFSANENYYIADMPVPGIHGHQKRGNQFVSTDNVAHGVRLQRNPKHAKRIKEWSWRNNPVKGTREFNGLRVMMALLSNWDMKDDNNAIYEDKNDPSRVIYGVTDVGASFGTSGKSITENASKNNLNAYRKHKFISKVTSDYVDFNFPTHPSFVYYFPLFEFPFIWREWRHRWIGRHIPREDVKWVGSLLSQLSPDQIRDAFKAAGYSPEQVDAYTAAVQGRIAEIAKL
jgi:hypothetical protein